MREQERIVTEVGLSLPRMGRLERAALKVIFGRFGKALMSSAIVLHKNEEIIPEVMEAMDEIRERVLIAGDFERGRITGKVIESGEEANQASGDFNISVLIRARREARNRVLD